MDGWQDDQNEVTELSTSYFEADNESLCYKYVYDGSYIDDLEAQANGVNPTVDCDWEAIAILYDNSNRSNPWFRDVTSDEYLEDTYNNQLDYGYEIIRAYTDDLEGQENQNYVNWIMSSKSLYCAPSNYSCTDMNETYDCDQCYGSQTYLYILQGYYEDPYNADNNDDDLHDDILFDASGAGETCGLNNGGATDYVDVNNLENYYYQLYSSTTTLDYITTSLY